MKLLIFTPTIKRSAIGRMASLVVQALVTQGHEVSVVQTEAVRFLDQPTHAFNAPIIAWNEFASVQEAAALADMCVYQIGNSYDFYEGCLHWLRKAPGIVCLHDFYVGHLFYSWAQSRLPEAHAILKQWYSEAMAADFFAHSNSDTFIDATCEGAPMTEWICSMAAGVVTHSSWGCDRVLKACAGPVSVAALPYDAPAAQVERRSPLRDNERLQLLTIGHVNPNKRVESVIKAIGSNATLRHNVTYKLVGHVQPEVVLSLSNMARGYGVDLVIAGEVDDRALAETITESDVVSCLRWPTLEAASASAIEAMLYGKAVICTDAGFYSEIPDEYVLKVSHENEISDISAHLTALIRDREKIRMIGEQAQRWAIDTFSAADYARTLTDMTRRALAAIPIIDACHSIAEIAGRWSATIGNPLREEDLAVLRIFSAPPVAEAVPTWALPKADDLPIA
ncbi:TPA: glycosyltransferase family 4 protein [Burkholderia vietnamiensis]|nr:glycosyltransferase family 4 protein [Burkholderia vietnamiensis]